MNKIEQLIEGLKILQSVGAVDMATSGGEIFIGHESLPLTESQKEKMEQMGWYIEEESWTYNV